MCNRSAFRRDAHRRLLIVRGKPVERPRKQETVHVSMCQERKVGRDSCARHRHSRRQTRPAATGKSPPTAKAPGPVFRQPERASAAPGSPGREVGLIHPRREQWVVPPAGPIEGYGPVCSVERVFRIAKEADCKPDEASFNRYGGS